MVVLLQRPKAVTAATEVREAEAVQAPTLQVAQGAMVAMAALTAEEAVEVLRGHLLVQTAAQVGLMVATAVKDQSIKQRGSL